MCVTNNPVLRYAIATKYSTNDFAVVTWMWRLCSRTQRTGDTIFHCHLFAVATAKENWLCQKEIVEANYSILLQLNVNFKCGYQFFESFSTEWIGCFAMIGQTSGRANEFINDVCHRHLAAGCNSIQMSIVERGRLQRNLIRFEYLCFSRSIFASLNYRQYCGCIQMPVCP